jgi:hypothetical protein
LQRDRAQVDHDKTAIRFDRVDPFRRNRAGKMSPAVFIFAAKRSLERFAASKISPRLASKNDSPASTKLRASLRKDSINAVSPRCSLRRSSEEPA